jgi:sugar phosphate isomerase/epimerase
MLRWRTPDSSRALAELKKAGWDGWEGRLSLDWMGAPKHLNEVCDDAGMPASGSPELRDGEHVERNKRRMDYAAEMGVGCFMFMNGCKPEGRPTDEGDIRGATFL